MMSIDSRLHNLKVEVWFPMDPHLSSHSQTHHPPSDLEIMLIPEE